jgi:beta-galactosidase
MKGSLFICFLLISAGIYAQQKSNASSVAIRTIPFDNNWLFTKDSVTNAEQADYNDSKWRTVNLPHDWSIEDLPAGQAGLPNQKPDTVVGPFSRSSIGNL